MRPLVNYTRYQIFEITKPLSPKLYAASSSSCGSWDEALLTAWLEPDGGIKADESPFRAAGIMIGKQAGPGQTRHLGEILPNSTKTQVKRKTSVAAGEQENMEI